LALFDLSKDVSEAHDLSGELLEKTQDLHRKLVAFLTSVDAETEQIKKK
jgi:hypothetical protein